MTLFPFIRLDGVQAGIVRTRAPWAILREGMAGGCLYAVRRGECWFELADPARRIRLREGDVVAVAKRRRHVLRDSLSTPIPSRPTAVPLAPIAPLADGGATELLVVWSSGNHPLEDLFPPLAYVPGDGSRYSETIRRALGMVELEYEDGGQPGSEAVLGRLSEIVVIELLRSVMAETLDPDPIWLRPLGDPSILRVITAMHERPAERWSLPSLAKVAGLSRSAFAARFQERVGEAPMQHLLRVRMRRAAVAVLEGLLPLPAIAESVGYESESAFHRAFRRTFGMTPGEWRARGRAPEARALPAFERPRPPGGATRKVAPLRRTARAS